MTRLPQIALLPDGKRLHLQDGPIDLVIEARGRDAEVRSAYQAAAEHLTGLLDELCSELAELRSAAHPDRCLLKGVVAIPLMHQAAIPANASQNRVTLDPQKSPPPRRRAYKHLILDQAS